VDKQKTAMAAEHETIFQGYLINTCINATLLKKRLHCVASAKQWCLLEKVRIGCQENPE